jgi:NADH dehydrogenase
MRARIFQPARTAMSSGTARTRHWVLEMVTDDAQEIDPLMGWTGQGDTEAQVRLRFDTREEALDYAEAQGIEAIVTDPHKRQPVIRAGGYGENFATSRRETWTH